MSFSGQRVVVIGGTSGIGQAVVQAAAERDAQVVVVSARQASVERALRELPPGATGHAVDVRDADALDAVFGRIGEFDHLVYTSGEALTLAPIADLDVDTARRFFEIRYFGVLAAVRAAMTRLSRDGSVTLTGGSAGPRPAPGWAVAASICGAMEALTREFALELAPVRVNLVRPGVVESPLWSALGERDRDALYQATAKTVPVGHTGRVEEVALAYLYCMEQTYATGAIIGVDGGAVLV
ncbi:SDR family oxidoreductase [Streptomyces sp. NPDC059743]|uniref:SDR family oxidoreductase n=1 Tax=Streptomyces sp. NPDC059743 TaxID=3346928 RepID=UPI003651B32E